MTAMTAWLGEQRPPYGAPESAVDSGCTARYIIEKFRCCGRCGNEQINFHLAAFLKAIFDDHGMVQSSFPELFTRRMRRAR